MKVIIMGCGRVGARLAGMLEEQGHEVTILDLDPFAFRFLPPNFRGTALVGNAMDVDVLRRAGIEQAEAFAAATGGDNRSVMVCQMAKHLFNVPRVVCRIYDPIREEMYRSLGMKTVSPTAVMAGLMQSTLLE